MNEIIKSIYERKSVRAYEDRPIPEEMKQVILESLYTILNITDQKVKEALVDTCDHQPFIAKAPLVLIFCADCKKWYDAFIEAGSEPRKPDVGDLMLAVSDAVIAAQNAVVAAESFVPAISEILSKIMRSSADCYSFRNMCFRRQCLCLDGQPNNKCSDRNHSV